MKLTLVRFAVTPVATLGSLRLDGRHECFVLEDPYRGQLTNAADKVPGRTAIPMGSYPVIITHSPRFNRELPLVDAVPRFSGIRIHPGNTVDDTEGCLLVGMGAHALPSQVGGFTIADSRTAFDALFAKLKSASAPMTLTIVHP